MIGAGRILAWQKFEEARLLFFEGSHAKRSSSKVRIQSCDRYW